MLSKNRTKAQEQWQQDLTDMGCCVSHHAHAERDHLFGQSAVSNGVAIGEWAVIPLNDYQHRNGPNNRTSKEGLFIDEYCNTDLWDMTQGHKKELFLATCCKYLTHYRRTELPFGEDVLLAIMAYR